MVTKLVLCGDTLNNFIKTVFFPSEEEIKKQEELRKARSKYIIKKYDDYFEVEIKLP